MTSPDGPREVHGSLMRYGSRPLVVAPGRFRVQVFRTLDDHRWAMAVICGDVTSPRPLLSRVHSSCVTSETLGGCDCDCVQQLEGALDAIAREGRGVLFYLLQEGRGAGLVAKARDRMLVQASEHRLTTFEAYELLGLAPDCRRYEVVSGMCELLGIEAPLELLTNNPEKVERLEQAKVRISEARPLRIERSAASLHYLNSKEQKGHGLGVARKDLCMAPLPEKVHWHDPVEVAGGALLRMASYLLPVDAGGDIGLIWLRLSLYIDALARRERVVLEYSSGLDVEPYVAFAPDSLLARFDGGVGSWRQRWKDCVRGFVRHGAGIAVFLPGRLGASRPGDFDPASVRLLVHHLAGRRPLLGSVGAGPECDREAHRVLTEAGMDFSSEPGVEGAW